MTTWATQPDTVHATDRPQEADAQTISRLRSSLIRALRVSPEAREALCDALELLESIQQKHDLEQLAKAPSSQAMRKRTRLQQYEIQRTPEGEFLVEHRPGQSQPFRCPRATYDAAAEVVAAAGEAMHFDELMEQLNGRTGERQPDYRLRVALRFWMSQQVVARFRTRYRAVDRAGFIETSRQLWDRLRQSD